MAKKYDIDYYNEYFHNYVKEDIQHSGELEWLLTSLSAQNVKFQFDRYNYYEALCNLHYIDEICRSHKLPLVVGEPYDTVRILDARYYYEIKKEEYPPIRKALKSALKHACVKIHMIGRMEDGSLFGLVDLFSPGIMYKVWFKLPESEDNNVTITDLEPWVGKDVKKGRELIKIVEERIEREEKECVLAPLFQ
ncbi:MAG: hypothetical protein IJO52_02170, partial [Clostridia bacterium]|nr:hypothetical protein [Clostridia bacterium]